MDYISNSKPEIKIEVRDIKKEKTREELIGMFSKPLRRVVVKGGKNA
ncbi:hypothetical protein IMSAG249_00284 [Lachnospiraceae bacterium]|jgi:hypothetical protein|nr:hypothetical protein IMSAG249_00284 [Lachnospiraceae bacterium]